MAKPTPELEFAEDANYPLDAAPEEGTQTKTDPAREDIGYRPNEHPTPQGFNWIINLIALWLRWLNAYNTRDITRSVVPRYTTNGTSDWSQHEDFIQADDNGSAVVNLDFLDVADRLKSIDVRVVGDGATDLSHVVAVYDQDGVIVGAALATTPDSNRSITPAWLNIFTGTRVLADGEVVRLTHTASGFSLLHRIHRIRVVYDRPSA